MKTALLIIDAQVGLLEGTPAAYRKDEVLTCIASLLETARHAGHEIIYVTDDSVGHDDPARGAVHPRIAPLDHDTVVRKTATSSFFRTGLDDKLKSNGIEHLVIAGCMTQFCIDTACRHAICLGYQVTLVADGHSTIGDGVLSAEQIVAHHNQNLDWLDNDEFIIRVRPLAEVEW